MFHKCGGRVSPTKILGLPKPKGIGNWKFESKLCGDQRFARDPLHFDQRAEGTNPIAVTMVRSVKMTSDGLGPNSEPADFGHKIVIRGEGWAN